jgi:diphthine synthase
MLSFIGLGLYDERSITVQGKTRLREADRVFAEFYTSKLAGTTIGNLERYHDVSIERRDRAGVEQDPVPILAAAEDGHAAFLTAGDTMISTTHVDLRMRAHERDVETEVIHGTTAQAAASSLTGLQNYRFGKATTLPFEETHGGVPDSVLETIGANRERDLHTLVFLDIDAEHDRYMTGDTAVSMLASHLDTAGVVVGQAGSDDPTVRADSLSTLADGTFGPPLHLLVIPGSLHPLERESLETFGDAPPDLLD